MIVGVQGTREFSDYQVFLRAMGVALSDIKNNEFTIYTAGPVNVNNFTSEFCNLSENSLKSRGISVKFYKVHPSVIAQSIKNFDYFAYFAAPHQKGPSPMAELAEDNGVEVGIFRY